MRERGYIRNPKNISENRDGSNQLYNEGSNVENGWVAEDKRRTRAWYRKGKKEVGCGWISYNRNIPGGQQGSRFACKTA